MRTLLFGACSVAALCAGLPAYAQIGEVIIVGYLEEEIPQELARYGTRVETVSAEEILNGGYVDITGVLEKEIPGMFIAARGGPFDYVNISYQGSRASDVLWLIDGVRFNNRLYAGTTPVDTIPAHMVERIEAIEGGQALFYGTQAIAGAVNIVTRDFSETSDGMIKGGLDTNGGRTVSGYYRDSIGPHQFVVYASHDAAEGFTPFRRSDMQPSMTDRDRSYDVNTYGGKYGIDLGNTLRLSTTYQHTSAQLDHTGPKGINYAFNSRDEDILTAKIDYTPTDNFELFIKGYYHWWYAGYSQANNTTPPGGPLTVFDTKTPWWYDDYGVNVLGKFDTGAGVEIFAGYDFQSYVGQDDVLLIAKQTAKVHAPFAQIRTTDDLIPNVRLSAGVRHNMPSDGEDATVWNVSGQWDVMPGLFVRSSVGTSFRLPTAEELYAFDACCTQGNPNLEPEEGFNVNASVGGNAGVMSGLSWEIIGFWRDVDNLIQADGADVYQNLPGTVETRGFQLVATLALTGDLTARADYTWAQSERSGTNQQIDDIPESFFKVGLDYAPMTMPFGVDISVLHVGDNHRTLGAFGRVNYGNYTVVDLNGRYFIDQDRKHRIGFGLKNVFDETYDTRIRTTTPDGGGPAYIYGHLGQPQTFYLNYSYAFSFE